MPSATTKLSLSLGGALAATAVFSATDVRADSLQFAGSTSIAPIITDAAAQFREMYTTWDQVDAALPAEEITIFVSGGGSSAGIRAAIDKSADAGMANREMSEAELEQVGDHELYVLGIDGIAIAAHRDNPLFRVTDDLSYEQIAQIFSGEIASYAAFHETLDDAEILLLTRDASGGNTQIMQAMVMGDRDFSPGAMQQPSTGNQLRRLESNTNAIAYMSSGAIWRSDDVRPFAVEGISPEQGPLVDGSYELQRRMTVIVPAENMTPQLEAFMDFLLSDAGQEIVAAHDYVPAAVAGN